MSGVRDVTMRRLAVQPSNVTTHCMSCRFRDGFSCQKFIQCDRQVLAFRFFTAEADAELVVDSAVIANHAVSVDDEHFRSSFRLEQIGDTAGAIWHYLDENGPRSLTQLIKDVDAPRDTIMQGIGWLAREDKLSIDEDARGRKTFYLRS